MLFTAPWADMCYFTYPIWVNFANRYSTAKVKFVEIDCGKFPKLARNYHISTSNMSNQLPTLLLLQDGKEVMRFPPIDEDTGKAARVISYKERELMKYFSMDARYLATQDIGIEKKKAFT